ncbi:trans-sialidase [Trypanosoma cruzi Dm28c]|uniref:Trans-sialidase n=2 Tax=Trypanosoma cruzi TaxID=5693 RepID=V5BDT9_TRYCR|nr:trans-sialidase [Trypanosoma cruzi Dm28c]PBJ77680.1 trans-sialidase [Trypanosoma cruzi cruzi]PWV02018.1 putative trans-sialidase, Group VI [Trypanosoma cruzi]
MLSRVAAVKAPCTHNRRCVTGSSGRRREGRASEPQRPNMSRHLFYSVVLLLFVMMCCNTVGDQQSDVRAPGPGTSLENHFVWRDKKEEEKVSSLCFPSLLVVNGKLFAVAEAQCTENDKVFTGIVSKLLTLGKKQTVEELDASKVKTQVLEECPSDKEKCASQSEEKDVSQSEAKVRVSRPTTVVKENDIYMLVGKYSPTAVVVPPKNDAEDCGLLLVKGKVGGESSDSIIWGDTAGVPCVSTVEEEKVGLTRLIGSGGSGVKMHDDTLVFPVQDVKEESGKTVSLLIYTSDNAANWTLSKGMSDGGCSDPSVVEWGEKVKKLIMMTACDDGRRRVYESGDKGESWTEALGTLSRVWGNKHEGNEKGVRSGFITATIDGEDKRNVMLVTLPVYSEKAVTGGNGKGKLHLWLTDNTHIVDIGPVSDDDAAASSLLYKSAGDNNEEEELIALYEKKKDGEETSHSLWSVLLTEQLQRVKEVLSTWKKVDETVSNLCLSSAEEGTSPGNACSPTVKITDGLVGFLSGNFSENTWKEEYLGVNATVKNNEGGNKATLHEDGVKFTGAWAEWPVGSQGENQLYHFANYNFTLVATVSIHKLPQEGSPISLMGAKMSDNGNSILFGLSYKKEKKWGLSCGGGSPEDHSITLATETKQHVVILLRNGNQRSAYVDGQRVGGGEACGLENKDSKEVSHFYIGGDGKGTEIREGVSVTVRNVLLYNRPLSSEEIDAFNPNKDPIQPLEKEAAKPSTVSSASVVSSIPPVPATSQIAGTSSTPAGTHLTEQGQPMGSSGADSGGASASAVSTVSIPPAEKDSVVQVTSGTSPDGTQTVGGGSTAVGETAMEKREGTDAQKEEVKPLNREVSAVALSSSLGNVSQGNNSDAGTVCGSGLLPSLPLLLGLWVFAAL